MPPKKNGSNKRSRQQSPLGKPPLKRKKTEDYEMKKCIDRIRPYLVYTKYEANRALTAKDNQIKKNTMLTTFKDGFWVRVEGKTDATKEIATTLVDSGSIATNWKTAVDNYKTTKRLDFAKITKVNKDETVQFTDDHIKGIVAELFYQMKFIFKEGVKEALQLEVATFLLDCSLVYKEGSDSSMRKTYKRLLTNQKDTYLATTNGILFPEPGGKDFQVSEDIPEDTAERRALKDYFDKMGRKNDHVLMIGGESGSGKTHLGVYAATYHPSKTPRKNLILYLKISETMEGLADIEKTYKNVKKTEKKKKEARDVEVATFFVKQMCSLLSLSKDAMEDLTKPVEKHDLLYFKRTFLIIDEVITSRVLMKALATSVDTGFMNIINKMNVKKFFGDTYFICCSTGSRDSISASGSSLKFYKSIQMKPSAKLFERLLKNDALNKELRKHLYMDIVQNRRCAMFAAKFIKSLLILEDASRYEANASASQSEMKTENEDSNGQSTDSVQNAQTTESHPQATNNQQDAKQNDENVVLDVLTNSPYHTISNGIVGHIVVSTAAAYAGCNGLASLTPPERMRLAAQVIREFVRLKLHDPPHKPFPSVEGQHDPIKKGIVDVHCAVKEDEKKNKKMEKVTLTFSRAQIILACSFYGTAAISADSPESFEVFSASLFALYLSALVGSRAGQFTVKSFFSSIDNTWKVGDATTEDNLNRAIERGNENNLGKVLYFDATSADGRRARLPFTITTITNDEKKDVASKVFADIEKIRNKYYIVTLVSPPLSPYADSFIICGATLFLIQSKKRSDFGANLNLLREEVLKMGLIPEGATPHERSLYAKSVVFTDALCKKLQITCVVPVFCVEEKVLNSKIHEMKVRKPNEVDVEEAVLVLKNKTNKAKKAEKEEAITFSENERFIIPMEVKTTTNLTYKFSRAVETESEKKDKKKQK